MVCIFAWHILVHGYDFKDIGGADYIPQISDEYAIVLSSLFAPATYCFMFISGYYGMNFSIKKLLMMESWLIISSLLTFFIGNVIFSSFSVINLLKDIFPVCTRRWWFMSSYMLIFILSPLINKGIVYLGKKDLFYIVVSLLLYQFLSFLQLKANAGTNFLSLLTVYLLARYCCCYNLQIKKNKALLLFVICWLVQIVLMFFCDFYNKKLVFKLLNYNTPFLILMSVSLFYYVQGLRPVKSEILNKLLQPTLFIYLITDGIYVPLYKWLAGFFCENIFKGVGFALVVIISCMILGKMIICLSEMLVNKIENREYGCI